MGEAAGRLAGEAKEKAKKERKEKKRRGRQGELEGSPGCWFFFGF